MDTRSPIPMRPPLKKRDRGARTPAAMEVQAIVDAGLIRAYRGGSVFGTVIATVIYVCLELGRAFL
ncbi:hypothetical protein [Rhizobium sp. PL01]|uniref:hypothetical protein n=1 Tax=Rhizobium sp. PL01 TaxID=3085631 RepID=UPI002982214F|nr:hypothetical protein [Rhizobium sp. PL01]MDW5314993.1 hypothetical protein [Rhizobium sp. PL01]